MTVKKKRPAKFVSAKKHSEEKRKTHRKKTEARPQKTVEEPKGEVQTPQIDQEQVHATVSQDLAPIGTAVMHATETPREQPQPEITPDHEQLESSPGVTLQPSLSEDAQTITPQDISAAPTPIQTPLQADSSTDVPPIIQKSPFLDDEQKGSHKRLVILLVILVILIGVVIGGFFYLQKKHMFSSAQLPQPLPVVTRKATPTPMVVPVDLTAYQITVLNGSGIAGEAAKVKGMLSNAGFSVATIGNATNSAFTQTIIQTKPTVPNAFVSKLKDSLSSSFTVGDTQQLASGSATSDVVVIVGKPIGQ